MDDELRQTTDWNNPLCPVLIPMKNIAALERSEGASATVSVVEARRRFVLP